MVIFLRRINIVTLNLEIFRFSADDPTDDED